MSASPLGRNPERGAHGECHSQALRSAQRPPLGRARLLWLWVALAGTWALMMREFGGTNVYTLLGPYAVLVTLAAATLGRPRVITLFRPSLRSAGWGVGAGLLMAAFTYPAYQIAAGLFPALRPLVATLYRATETTTLGEALAWVTVIVVAEEVLWRGVGLFELTRYVGPRFAFALSVASYALAQLGTGSWVVGLVALVCGTLWTLERVWLDAPFAALISHWLWTCLVILLFPLG